MKRFTQMIVFNTAALKKSFMLLFLSTAAVFAGVGLFILGPAKMVLSSSSVQTVVKGISNEAFLDVLEQELPYMSQMVQASDRASASFSDLMFQLVTNINPRDPRSFLGRELPGFELYDFEILVAEQNADYRDFFPMESMPPESVRQGIGPKRSGRKKAKEIKRRNAMHRSGNLKKCPLRTGMRFSFIIPTTRNPGAGFPDPPSRITLTIRRKTLRWWGKNWRKN